MSSLFETPDPLYLDCGGNWPTAVLPYDEENTGTPVIMLHGLESHSAWFAQSARYIASLGYPVYGMERRGSGRSAAPRGLCKDFHEWVEEIDGLASQLLSRHGTRQFILLGHCFGAIPATAYACAHSSRLKSLILATPAVYTIAEPPLAGKLKVLWAALSGSEIKIPVPLQAEWFTDQEEFLNFIENDSMSLHEASARLYWEVARARKYIHANEQELRMPVFMALAGKDRICDDPRDSAFFKRIPASEKRCFTYAKAVHILEFSTEKTAFFRDLGEWLSGLPQPALKESP